MENNNITPSSSTMADEILEILWQWRIELTIAALIAIVYWACARRVGYTWSAVIVASAIAALLCLPSIRRLLARTLRLTHWRRRFVRALVLQSSPLAKRQPKVIKALWVPSGMRLTLSLQSGTAFHELEHLCPYLAIHFGARDVRVTADRTNASRAELTIYNKDPFGDSPIHWSGATAEMVSAWDPISLGIDEEGEEVSVSLVEHNLLGGGEPGSGKSGLINTMLASLVMDPAAELYLFDPKEVELAPWRSCAKSFVGGDMDEAIRTLEQLQATMEYRYALLANLGARKFERHHGHGLIVVVIDELPYYVANSDVRSSRDFASRLRDLIARGRAAGIVVIAAAQKPSADTVPSFIRDLIGLRVAFRCSTREASDTILGGGWATQGFSATSIPMGQRGVGLLLGDDAVPKLMKTYWLSDEAIRDIVGRAFVLGLRRAEKELEALPKNGENNEEDEPCN
ncbi:FtsK/SpoIIIE domain-containing protein [Ferrimicrobium acidiphilum]|uniref:FtsK/SpoIIIE domain-containing protein n=1 Tax=Ferrimicrobium acidiphilum TaxID=121039 RepID=UPI0023F1647D|nr:FtsK/SpoIIIE domain-containing protein [Ferrimicrobium acidiphilum]